VKLLGRSDWNAAGSMKLGGELIELQQFLHGFLIYHLGKIPKGRVAALGV